MPKIKICTKCKKEKLVSEFYKSKDHKGGFYTACKECAKQYQLNHKEKLKKQCKDWYKKNKNKVRNNALLRNYGITLDNYNDMFMNQRGCCAICGKHQAESTLSLSVDHSHKSGEIRGLLCGKCNHALGNVNEDTDILLSMVDYLNGHNPL